MAFLLRLLGSIALITATLTLLLWLIGFFLFSNLFTLLNEQRHPLPGTPFVLWYKTDKTEATLMGIESTTFSKALEEGVEVSDAPTGTQVEIEIPETIAGLPVTGCLDHGLHHAPEVTHLVLPNSLKQVSHSPFQSCPNLVSVTVSEDHPHLSSAGGVLFSRKKWYLLYYPPMKPNTEYTLPDTVVQIEPYAFLNAAALATVRIPDSVKTLGEGAFHSCANLSVIEFGKGVETIGDYAFTGTALNSVTLPASLKNLGRGAFAYLGNLTSVSFSGDAPLLMGVEAFEEAAGGFHVLYPKNAKGFSTPEWSGYPARPMP